MTIDDDGERDADDTEQLMPYRIMRRISPKGGMGDFVRPQEHRILSSHDTSHEAEQVAEALVLGFAYHRFDREQNCWRVQDAAGHSFTISVERA